MTDDETPEADRFKQLDGVELEQDAMAENIRRAFAKRSPLRRAKYEARAKAESAIQLAQVKADNRAGALRTVFVDGVQHFFGACACKWHGLRVGDPELALREYDAHPCTISLYDDSVIDRELKYDADGRIIKRTSIQAVNQVLPDGQVINTITPDSTVGTSTKTTTEEEDQAKRFSLLELK